MATLLVTGFSGEILRLIPRLLPDNAAQEAFDVRLEDGSLSPLREPLETFSDPALPLTAPATIYKHGSDWLYWAARVNAAPGPVATDRLYFTGDGAPKVRIASTNYTMAITAPSVALTAALGGSGSGDSTTSIWVYTNVSQFSEESEPCPVSNEITWQPGNTVTLSGFSTSMGDRTATYQRIYRSVTAASGSTSFYLVAERAAGTGNYVDNLAADNFTDPLPSLNWNQPPADLHSLIPLPNGMMAGLSGKQLCFCEPFMPHAWPEEYRLTLDYTGVALGAFGTSIAVLTEGNPYIATGTHPDSIVLEKLELNLPCVNAAAVVDLGYAVAYPSHDGLVLVSAGGPRLATEQLMSRDDWQRLVPETIIAGQYNGRYVATYSYYDAVAEQQFEGTLVLDLTGGTPFLLRNTVKALSFFYEITTGSLYYLQDGIIYQWDPDGGSNKTYSWRSKEFLFPTPTNFGAILVDAETLTQAELSALQALIAAIEAANAAAFAADSIGGEINGGPIGGYAINGDDMQEIPSGAGTMTVNVYADKGDGNGKVLVGSITQANVVKRLPSGFKARLWEIEVSANLTVTQVALAGAAAELGQVQ